ncbi:MAG: precorrin-2 C(20)-methyltransferase [Pseudomonadota bacterium]|nr:precorrin-2 C(20)-methyltransferase [Pseudomonadota bacterium]MDE3038568.1 precorrin-2 C(20)-methyltransferase [Pseudomonadota bacterium]
MTGTLYGVGLGPGDPELMTLKAARILRQARVVAWFSKGGKRSHAHTIAASQLNAKHEEMPLIYPVTTEYQVDAPEYEQAIGHFYEESCEKISTRLAAGEDVTVLCAGDPFFYGSFMHLYRRLADRFHCHVVPGVTAMSGGWTNAHAPIAWGDDILTVLPGTLDSGQLAGRLKATDAAVIMKLGRNFARVREAIIEAGMLERAIYIAYGTMKVEQILPLKEKLDTPAPYFSLIIIPGNGRRL